MKVALSTIPVLILTLLLGFGCTTEKAKPTSAIDVGGHPQTVAPAERAVAVAPVPPAPAYQPELVAPRAPAIHPNAPIESAVVVESAAPKPAEEVYVVQKGDTLFKIAKIHYGDGSKWQKIASANPGLSANTLKVGQKITLPTL